MAYGNVSYHDVVRMITDQEETPEMRYDRYEAPMRWPRLPVSYADMSNQSFKVSGEATPEKRRGETRDEERKKDLRQETRKESTQNREATPKLSEKITHYKQFNSRQEEIPKARRGLALHRYDNEMKEERRLSPRKRKRDRAEWQEMMYEGPVTRGLQENMR
ncbi:nucleic-acid-binding protein from mobile element jockey [Lasius niger]|uniref:Nucleic-acid-binding protein from mobile element jockey n=1 Tax=Lasius niger TaxID=67767 RepID=A0A0J7JUV7_LASNI|nr:nucleic-acid-binding protein from mobile element jockey [Lasius niger]